jgi:hypothetical protein
MRHCLRMSFWRAGAVNDNHVEREFPSVDKGAGPHMVGGVPFNGGTQRDRLSCSANSKLHSCHCP